jgi:Carboxypeptidase regulatory-like domain
VFTRDILCAVILAILIAAGALLAQDAPVLINQNGTVSGVLRDSSGAPAAGVRVSAMARPDEIRDLAAASSFGALAETDSAGRFRLENVPPGRYYIVAGRVDAPTYYPGTVQLNEGKVVQITPGIVVEGINFVLNNGSVGRANPELGGSAAWVIPIQARIEGGGKIPLFVAGQFPVLRLTRYTGNRTDVSLNTPSVTVSEPGYLNNPASVPDYRVTIENLPNTYALKSLTFGSTDLRVDALKLPRGNAGSTVTQSIVITLTIPSAPQPAGVRVSGKIPGDAKRGIYISGNSGAIYSDGTFEFIGVSPGRHNIVTLDNPGAARSLGATLIVGDRELTNIELGEISVAPMNFDQPAPPSPAGGRLPGVRTTPASIHGRVSDGDTHEPFNAGKIVLNDNFGFPFPLNDDGKFDIPNLLPGRYVLDAVVFGIGNVRLTVELDEQDTTLELTLTSKPGE